MNWWIDSAGGRAVRALVLLPYLSVSSFAQNVHSTGAQSTSPGASEDPRFIVDDERFENEAGKQTEQLSKEGRLVDYTALAKQAPRMRPAITLPPVSTKQLTPTELASLLRHSTVAVGLRYQEPHSKKWTFMIGATAFAVAPGILSTSLHVMSIDPEMMREAQSVAVTEDGSVFPITGILAASERSDSCLVLAPGLDLPPLPLRGGVLPGEQIWCMSHPDGFSYMFTSGQVARISRDRYLPKEDPSLHVEVTAEYCPGSSGGAVTDSAGNVVAQVSCINNYDGFTSRDGKTVNGIVSARTCTAAEELIALASPGQNEAIPVPTSTPRPKKRSPKPTLPPPASPKGAGQPKVGCSAPLGDVGSVFTLSYCHKTVSL